MHTTCVVWQGVPRVERLLLQRIALTCAPIHVQEMIWSGSRPESDPCTRRHPYGPALGGGCAFLRPTAVSASVCLRTCATDPRLVQRRAAWSNLPRPAPSGPHVRPPHRPRHGLACARAASRMSIWRHGVTSSGWPAPFARSPKQGWVVSAPRGRFAVPGGLPAHVPGTLVSSTLIRVRTSAVG